MGVDVIKMSLVDILHACLLHIGWLGGWASLLLIHLPVNPETEFCCWYKVIVLESKHKNWTKKSFLSLPYSLSRSSQLESLQSLMIVILKGASPRS